MKLNMQRKGNIAEAPGRHVVRTSQVKKSTNRQRGPGQKASGVLPFSATAVLSRDFSVSESCIETRKEATPLELKHGKVDPLTKIKLQLFPVNEVTRIGLEKDGLNPFLELTLRARKKISSVIKHIHTKWGGSSIAIGETMLLPYDAPLRHRAMSRRWTIKDTVISAGDVYRAVGSPAIFRLSYGWFSDHEPQSEPPRVPAAAALHNCIESESMQEKMETTEERKPLDATSEVAVTEHVDTGVKMSHIHEWSISPWVDDITNLRMGGLLSEASGPGKISNHELKSNLPPIFLSTDISVGGLLSEASMQEKLRNNEQGTIRWDDSLTALSIGGLLSEASLQAKINKSDSKSSERDVVGPSSTFISDSFDAFISSQVKSNPQMVKPSSLDSRSSILDAEETCHAFSFRKFSSSSKNIRVSARASQDLSSNSFRFPDLLEVSKQTVDSEDTSCSEPKMELFPIPQQYGEDSRALG
ncbi:TSL-kinase interacting protein 1 [Cynara cardunculus var. scolymus]|uniref:TSL-kinase interacting protein 1 n=1 Tax=Cynara cardunculus var. scolymus TaxID=59895 RepID=UPI000D629BB1|nr:TSL-kinase interacting protein 1 [Cynara cardunculus var. scolymus]